MKTFKYLLAYQKSYEIAMEIFQLTKSFPKEELFSLTDQIRRSSRSVSANIAESFRKRRYKNHFISKLSDADMECAESQVWIEMSFDCGYLTRAQKDSLLKQYSEIGKLIGYMMQHPEKFT